MNSSELNGLLDEATGFQAPIAHTIEGLEDYLRLDLNKETIEQVRELLESYTRRRDILTTLVRALSDTKGIIDALVSDGHPDDPVLNVKQDVLADLRHNLAGLTGAIEKFHGTQAPASAKVAITGPGVVGA